MITRLVLLGAVLAIGVSLLVVAREFARSDEHLIAGALVCLTLVGGLIAAAFLMRVGIRLAWGAIIGFAAFLTQFALAYPLPSLQPVLALLNAPVGIMLQRLTNRSSEHLLGPWLLAYPIYWILLGVAGSVAWIFVKAAVNDVSKDQD
jgi:hypothetical protein